jgi:hypothetical protein
MPHAVGDSAAPLDPIAEKALFAATGSVQPAAPARGARGTVQDPARRALIRHRQNGAAAVTHARLFGHRLPLFVAGVLSHTRGALIMHHGADRRKIQNGAASNR